MALPIEDIFRANQEEQDNFMARLYGIFNEDATSIWCNHPKAPYTNLGRPSIYIPDPTNPNQQDNRITLDFTLRHKASGKTYICEMKCWTAFEKFKYIRLKGSDQLEKAAKQHFPKQFEVLKELAKEPAKHVIKIDKIPHKIDGAILIWAAVTDMAREEIMERYSFADVLSVENILNDLKVWSSSDWAERVSQYQGWSKRLFDGLVQSTKQTQQH